MTSNANLRPYEVSIWTLQDSFITILKKPFLENKGTIQEGKVIIKDDGTQELTFSLPMYLYNTSTGKQEENPIWYTTQNGILIADMRKIKLIINKREDNEKVYEFVITDVTERHTSGNLYCDVKCEGLAFQELGKKGYRISLTADDFNADDWDWFNKTEDANGNLLVTSEPHATLQYWNDKVFKDNMQWTYEIRMDWSAYSTFGLMRATDRVYEEEYVASWDNTLSPSRMEMYKEKERLVNLEDSNIYNITQALAETFGVFCKYEYEYNEDYSIKSRKVVYYNNFLNEKAGPLDITYPYATSNISREMDSTELVTKMYVEPVTNSASATGYTNIMNVEANKTGEDYLLNFDYLYTVGAISEDQYNAVTTFEKNIRTANNLLIPLEQQIVTLQDQVPELEAAVALHTTAIQLDKERWSAADALLNNLTGGTGVIHVTKQRPETCVMLSDSTNPGSGSYYIKITKTGVLKNTVKIYRSFNYNTGELSDQINTGHFENDEFGNLTKITNLYPSSSAPTKRTLYLTFDYQPSLYYEQVKQTWVNRQANDEAELAKSQAKLDNVNTQLRTKLAQYDTYLSQKKDLIIAFESLMGPALREGYWTPDDYNDYGDKHTGSFTLNYSNTANQDDKAGFATLIWDSEHFDEEQHSYFEQTISQIKIPYYCLNLTDAQMTWLRTDDHYKTAGIIFHDVRNDQTNRTLVCMSLGSQCHFGFIKNGSTAKPVIIMTGATTLTTDVQTNIVTQSYGHAVLGIMSTELVNNQLVTKVTSSTSITDSQWQKYSVASNGNGDTVFPRIKINSLSLKTDSNELSVTYYGESLTNFENYSVLARDGQYYVTLKPEIIIKYGNNRSLDMRYSISNADTAIYLDAIQVLKENSQPRVSYSVDVNVADPDFVATDYDKLGYICHINDPELKFENVMGYISELDLDLDHPWLDKLTIKNYKTKFEDLFSKIVASSEAMRKSEYIIGLAAQAFTTTGEIDATTFSNSFKKVDLNYAFNNGKLTISEKDGIWGSSDSGVVAFRGGGIFTAYQRDVDGNWIWNTGITPEGINANLITTGQLDTNRIKVYAGDKLRFQLNADGLYAYKSFLEDQEIISSADFLANASASTWERLEHLTDAADGMTESQYVRFWENGLFLTVKAGSMVLNSDKTDYITINQDVDRVEISWEGLKLRNWNNQEMFWADPDTGNLYLQGTIRATDGWFGGDHGWIIDNTGIYTYNYPNASNGIALYHGYLNPYVTSPSIQVKSGGIERFYVNANVSGNGNYFYVGNGNDKYLRYNNDGNLYLSGTIYATAGWFGSSSANGWVITDNGIWTNNYSSSSSGIYLRGGSTPAIEVKQGNSVKFQVNSAPASNSDFIFFTGTGSNSTDKYMGFTKDGNLVVRGDIKAINGYFGYDTATDRAGWTINSDGIFSGVTSNGSAATSYSAASTGMYLRGGNTPMVQLKKGGTPFFQFNGSPSNGFYFFIGADINSSAYNGKTVDQIITSMNSNSNIRSYMGFADSGLYIKGNITASSISAASGYIGGWQIGSSTLTGGQTTLNSNGTITVGGTTIGADGSISTGSAFSVDGSGNVTMTSCKVDGQYVNLAG